MTALDIKQTLEKIFVDDGTYIEVKDDSHQHVGHREAPPDGGSHFTVIIISPVFKSLSRVKRHQLIYKTLHDALNQGVHALAIKAMTPDEAKTNI